MHNETLYIESRQNPRLKELAHLWDRKHRERMGLFLVEGQREIEHAMLSAFEMTTLFFCPELFSDETPATIINNLRSSHTQKTEIVRLSKAAFEKISRRQGPDGLLAVAQIKTLRLGDLKLNTTPLLFIVEGIEKPGNLGAMLRTADAAGVDALIMVNCAVDLFNPNVIRTSQGMVFHLPVVDVDMAPLQHWLEDNTIQPIALTPHASETLWQLDLTIPTAFVFGAEDKGLSEQWMHTKMHPCKIPMSGAADSLNVSATAAICAFEARRQRNQQL